jgi:hypothetical protein
MGVQQHKDLPEDRRREFSLPDDAKTRQEWAGLRALGEETNDVRRQEYSHRTLKTGGFPLIYLAACSRLRVVYYQRQPKRLEALFARLGCRSAVTPKENRSTINDHRGGMLIILTTIILDTVRRVGIRHTQQHVISKNPRQNLLLDALYPLLARLFRAHPLLSLVELPGSSASGWSSKKEWRPFR